MSTATSQSQQRVATQPPAPGLPDGTRVQEQLAALTEGGEIRPLLEFLRTLLNARALAVFPTSDRPGAASVAVTTRGILATSLEPLAARLGNATAAGSKMRSPSGPMATRSRCRFYATIIRYGF
jgi:hypothetical protein